MKIVLRNLKILNCDYFCEAFRFSILNTLSTSFVFWCYYRIEVENLQVPLAVFLHLYILIFREIISLFSVLCFTESNSMFNKPSRVVLWVKYFIPSLYYPSVMLFYFNVTWFWIFLKSSLQRGIRWNPSGYVSLEILT